MACLLLLLTSLLLLLDAPFLLAFSPLPNHGNHGRSHIGMPGWKHATTSTIPPSSSTLLQAVPKPPPPPDFRPKPLPVLLGGGLFLFRANHRGKSPEDRRVVETLLQQAQDALRQDPTVTLELGSGVEAGGVYASQKTHRGDWDQLVVQFQIQGGNAWAQGVAYGVRSTISNNNNNNNKIRLVSLEVANMDASMNGTPLEVPIRVIEEEEEEEESL